MTPKASAVSGEAAGALALPYIQSCPMLHPSVEIS